MNTQISVVNQYIEVVLKDIQAPDREKQRIAMDLRDHFQAAQEANEPFETAARRLGEPQEVAAAYMAQMMFEFAGFWPRLAAFAIDLAVIMAAAGALSLLALALANQVPEHPVGMGYVAGALVIAWVVGCGLAAAGIIILYFPIQEGRFGYTLGKKVLRLHVLKEDGLPIGYKDAFLRRISYYFEILPVDALFILFNAKRQRAFDIVARTIVIKEA